MKDFNHKPSVYDITKIVGSPSFDVSTGPPDIYLEGSDACGKDTVANLIDSQRELSNGPEHVKTIKSASFFSPEVTQQFALWCQQYPDVDMSGFMLAATVFDLATFEPSSDDTPRIQISHNAIRGAAFQEAFDLPLSDLFAASASILPRQYWPVALTATIPELQRRVKENPSSTPFDFLVCEQPDKVEIMINAIRDKCILLGGIAVDTTMMAPHEVAGWVDMEANRTTRLVYSGLIDPKETADEILGELSSRNPAYAPVTLNLREMLYER